MISVTATKTHDFWVNLEPAIAAEWAPVLGSDGDRLPVQSPIAKLANLPGFEEPQWVYMLATDQLTKGQLRQLADRLALKFGLPFDVAMAELRTHGIPIREEHIVCVTVRNPQRWL